MLTYADALVGLAAVVRFAATAASFFMGKKKSYTNVHMTYARR
jgi:hypothetical protein